MRKVTGVQRNVWEKARGFALVLLVLLCASTVMAQGEEVDFGALVREIQRVVWEEEEFTIIWWIPEEYWLVNLAQNPNVPEDRLEEFLRVLSSYTIVAVVEGKIGPFGGVTYTPEEIIWARIAIKDSQGVRYRPLSRDEIDADARVFLSVIKPFLANKIGPLGENLHFFLFPSRDKEGRRIANAKSEGVFAVILGGREFRWKLPLVSLLPPKICPTCGERLSGAYKFCPWDGTKLPEARR